MNSTIDIIIPNQIEGFAVMLCRMIVLCPGKVEADDPTVLEGHRKLSDTKTRLGCHVADSADDQPSLDVVLVLRLLESIEYGLNNLVQAKTAIGVEDGGVAHFEVAHVFPCGIFGNFEGCAGRADPLPPRPEAPRRGRLGT